jgi:thioredoxin reductase (NADPH)
VGGGDSALEEGLFLTRFARKVRIIHRRDQLRASNILQERARCNPKIIFGWNSVVTSVNGQAAVESVTLKNVQTGAVSTLPTQGVFVYIGHDPNNQLFRGQLEMDEHGCLIVDRHYHTGIAGVFAAGEITDPVFRQLITSAGEGCKAAMEAIKYLSDTEGK